MSEVFNLMVANAATVREPIPGQTGVWVYNSKTLVSSAMKMSGVVVSGWRNSMIVLSRGSASSTQLISSGYLYVSSGGVANMTTVNSRGCYLHVSNGGTATATTVDSYSYLFVSSGGTALDILENGGYVEVSAGATAIFAANSFSGLVLSNADATVHSNTVAEAVTLNRYGRLYIYDGGVANETTLNSGGYLRVNSGGNVYDVTVSAGGRLGGFSWNETRHWDAIENGTAVVAKNVTIVGDYMYVSSGGTATETIVSNGYL